MLNQSSMAAEKVTKYTEQRDNFLKNFAKLVESHNEIVLFHHVRADGDCLGGVYGMKEVLKQKYPNKNIYAVGDRDSLFPWLFNDYPIDELPMDYDRSKALAVIIDVGTSDRIKLFNEYFSTTDNKWSAVVKIDHHETESDFHVDLGWDDPTYAAACCQLVQTCDYYGWEISPKAATFLFLGIATDSGYFSYSATIPRTLVLAAKTWRCGASKDLISGHLTHRTFKFIKFQNFLLDNVQKGSQLLWYYLKLDVARKFGISDNMKIANVFSNIEDNIMWMGLREATDGTVKVELRSLKVSVRELAIEFGGGGHPNASGCFLKSEKDIPHFIQRAQETVTKFIEEHGQPHVVGMLSGEASCIEDTLKETVAMGKDEIEKSQQIIKESEGMISSAQATLKEIEQDDDKGEESE